MGHLRLAGRQAQRVELGVERARLRRLAQLQEHVGGREHLRCHSTWYVRHARGLYVCRVREAQGQAALRLQQEAGARSPYAQCVGPGAHVSAQVRTKRASAGRSSCAWRKSASAPRVSPRWLHSRPLAFSSSALPGAGPLGRVTLAMREDVGQRRVARRCGRARDAASLDVTSPKRTPTWFPSVSSKVPKHANLRAVLAGSRWVSSSRAYCCGDHRWRS